VTIRSVKSVALRMKKGFDRHRAGRDGLRKPRATSAIKDRISKREVSAPKKKRRRQTTTRTAALPLIQGRKRRADNEKRKCLGCRNLLGD